MVVSASIQALIAGEQVAGSKLNSKLRDELLAEGDTEQALKISEEFQAEWETIHGQLCLFLQHEHLDPLESVFAVLPYYIEQGEITLAQSECRLVRSVTEHILKTERVTLENIL